MLCVKSHKSRGSRMKRRSLEKRRLREKHDPPQPSEQERTEHEMTHFSIPQLVQTLHQGKGARGGLSQIN